MGFVTDIQFVDTLANFYAHTPYIPIVLDNSATCHRATRFSGLYVTLPPTRDLMGTWRIVYMYCSQDGLSFHDMEVVPRLPHVTKPTEPGIPEIGWLKR